MADYAIIVHGGAGRLTPEGQPLALQGCREAAAAGAAILAAGGSALDAVERAVSVLEDDPCFNAGTGSVLNSRGQIELDASIMEGPSRRAGAVAAVRGIRNPVQLARRVLEDGRHVLLAGEGARAFARDAGIAECDERSLIVPRQWQRWQERYDTVGAVAIDRDGRLAAATSTGGTFGKLPGRVGDSPLIGCGTFADGIGAVSCTGVGEAIIRTVLAHTVASGLPAAASPREAAERGIRLLEQATGQEAGLIVVDNRGRMGWFGNAPHMAVGYASAAEPEARAEV